MPRSRVCSQRMNGGLTKARQLKVMKKLQVRAASDVALYGLIKAVRGMAKSVAGSSPAILYACTSAIQALVEMDPIRYGDYLSASLVSEAEKHCRADRDVVVLSLARHATRAQRERIGLSRALAREAGGPVRQNGVTRTAILRSMLPDDDDLMRATAYRFASMVWVYPQAEDALEDVLIACAMLSERIHTPRIPSRTTKIRIHDKMWIALRKVNDKMRRREQM